MSSHLAVTRVVLPRFVISTTMTDSHFIHTPMLEVIPNSKNDHVFIRDLSDLTLQIVFHTRSASMNVDVTAQSHVTCPGPGNPHSI